jgi:hypothetical protein
VIWQGLLHGSTASGKIQQHSEEALFRRQDLAAVLHETSAVVGNLDDDLPHLRDTRVGADGLRGTCPLRRTGRSLDTMIDRVPRDVREKIFDGFDELDLLPFYIDARKSFIAANNS